MKKLLCETRLEQKIQSRFRNKNTNIGKTKIKTRTIQLKKF